MMSHDLRFMEGFQNKVFAKLIKDVGTFEHTYNVVIR